MSTCPEHEHVEGFFSFFLFEFLQSRATYFGQFPNTSRAREIEKRLKTSFEFLIHQLFLYVFIFLISAFRSFFFLSAAAGRPNAGPSVLLGDDQRSRRSGL